MEINLNLAARILFFIPTISISILAQAQTQVEDDDMLFYDMPSVFTASKYEQKISEAPARVSVITAEEIQRYGYRSLSEALQSLPGIQLSYDHTYTYLGVRGLNVPGDFNTRVLVLIDGHRLNENIYDGALIDQGNIVSIDMIKQIEMIRGPASSLYGSNAVLGVINIITKDGRDLNGSQISVDTGSHDTHQGRISYGKQYGSGVELLVSASLYRSEGDDRYFAEYDDPATNNGVAEEADDSNNDSLLVKLSYGDFSLSTVYGEYEKVIPTGAYETLFNDNHTVSIEGRSYINLEYQTLLADSMEVSGKLYYDKYWYDGDYFYDGEGDPNYVYKDKNQGEWWGVEGQLTKVLFDSHRLTSGLEYRQTFTAEQEAFDVYENYLDIDTRQ
ncbi:MAG: TonB-dependent receptor plug domain-containing protein, partial [Colwellia sp.]